MPLCRGELGVHPPGALGVAFFVHAHGECLVGRSGDGITEPLKQAGQLLLEEGGRQRALPLKGRIFANLLEADALDRLPELLLVCCNPNQLGDLTAELTRFLESLAERGRLRTLDDLRTRVPILLVLPNGIVAEQTVQTYAEQLAEARLMDRLPDLSDGMVAALLERVVRGISLQAGGRRGLGRETVYLLERQGMLLFAGGGEPERQRVEAILTSHDYPFTHARGVPGTRIEFDKAMISIVLNVGGLIHTVQSSGELIDLRMGDLCTDPAHAEFVATITRAVFDVGQAVGAYGPADTYDAVWAEHRATILKHADHVTSSLKTFRDALGAGLNGVRLFSNEEWILTPLTRYAGNAGLAREEELFRSLRTQIQQSMARAIRFRDQSGARDGTRARNMKLAAQRNIGIELFECGDQDLVLIGTMLDGEHLIKLELNVHLPDEQITRSKLDMIRVPFPVCREVESAAERLVGLRIERGVLQEIATRVGGRVGCSHIKELATSIIYFGASHLMRRKSGLDPADARFGLKPADERFSLTRGLLRDSCLAYCQSTAWGLDERIGIRRVGEDRTHPVPLGDYEPSLGALLQERGRRLADKVYLRERKAGADRELTWKQFAASVFQIARHLLALGIRHGDRIGMVSENRSEMYLCEMAAMSIGAVSVPVYAGYPAPQLAFVLGHAHPRMLVVSGPHQLEKLQPAHRQSIEHVFCMDCDAACRAWGARPFDALLCDGGADESALAARVAAVRPDDLCMIMYTSGTTGVPKGVKLLHRNLISQQKGLSLIWDVSERDVFLSYLPWHHSFGGLFERFMTLYQGCELCLDDSNGRDIRRLLENWRRFQPTIFFSVPRVHALLTNECRENAELDRVVFGGRLRFVFTAGAPLPAQVEAAYRARHIPVLEGWGLTETAPCVTVTPRDGVWRSGYVGLPIPGVTVRIDADQEILVRGPNVMEGYLDDEETTGHVKGADGWFRTGDVGEFTPDGLRIFGRKDGAFKLTNGEKVHPFRIESALVNESPYIALALAIGSGQDYVGALLCPNFGRLRAWAAEQGIPVERLTADPRVLDLFATELERVNQKIPVKYHRVRRAALMTDEPSLSRGELTPSGKLVRKLVLEHYKRGVEDLYGDPPRPGVIIVGEPSLAEASIA